MTKRYISIAIIFFAAILFQGCAAISEQSSKYHDNGNGICTQISTGLMWQVDKTKLVYSIEEARDYANNLQLGGYDDWRLPTIYELYEMNYAFDLHKEGNCTIEREGNFWFDEKDGDGFVGAWEISDQCEPERQYFAATKGYVRVVRP